MSRFVDSPLLEDDGEDLPEVPSRLEDYDDDALAMNSTNALFEAKYPSHAASKNSSRNSTYGAYPSGDVNGEYEIGYFNKTLSQNVQESKTYKTNSFVSNVLLIIPFLYSYRIFLRFLSHRFFV